MTSREISYALCSGVIEYYAIGRMLVHTLVLDARIENTLLVGDLSSMQMLVDILQEYIFPIDQHAAVNLYSKNSYKKDVDFDKYDLILILDPGFIIRPKEGSKIREFIQGKPRSRIVFIDRLSTQDKSLEEKILSFTGNLCVLTYPVMTIDVSFSKWIMDMARDHRGVSIQFIGISDLEMALARDLITSGLDMAYRIEHGLDRTQEEVKRLTGPNDIIDIFRYTLCSYGERGIIVSPDHNDHEELVEVKFYATFDRPDMDL